MLPDILKRLRIPVMASPMFIVSGPELVIAQCKAGIVGSFPALNAREKDGEPPLLETWLTRITEERRTLFDKYSAVIDNFNQVFASTRRTDA